MAPPGGTRGQRALAGVIWMALLALLPWWLGLPLLLTTAMLLTLQIERLAALTPTLLLSLRWGLPGVLVAVYRWLGGGGLGLTAALSGALAGFTLLAALEAWLKRGTAAGSTPLAVESTEWPARVFQPAGPPAAIIELAPPRWCEGEQLRDPRGQPLRFELTTGGAGRFYFADGRQLDAASARACFSPGGYWFASQSRRGVMLWDARHDHQHRLRHWQLCGWQVSEDGGEQPWLIRSDGSLPVRLAHALGQGEATARH